MGIAHLRACQGRSYHGPIKLTPKIAVLVVYCTGLHPSLDSGEQTVILMTICAPLTVLEDLKFLFKEGLAKLCQPGMAFCSGSTRHYSSPFPPGSPVLKATTSW